jgi:hypothetical protein
MQADYPFASYQVGPEMSESDAITYFDLVTASPEELQAGEDTIMADMFEAEATAVSSQPQFSSSMDFEMTTDSFEVQYGYDEFGERYGVQTPALGATQLLLGDEAGYKAFLAEINEDAKQKAAATKAGKKLVREAKKTAQQQAAATRAEKKLAMEAKMKAQQEKRDACAANEAARLLAIPEIKTIFNDKNVRADLIRCPPLDPHQRHDNIDVFARDYVRGLRLLTVKRRWVHITSSDWIREIRLVLKAVKNPKGDLELFEPLAEWLEDWRSDCFKRGMLMDLEQKAKEVMADNREAIEDLLAANNMVVKKGSWMDAQYGVELDCEKRGSLLLGTIPEFTQHVAGGFSGKWSWTEERRDYDCVIG